MQTPSPLRSRLLFFLLTVFLGAPVLIAPHVSFAQSPPRVRKRPAPPPAPPAEDQQQFISYWTTETGWRTELQLRNNQVSSVLTVTPVLRSADGSETPLSPVVVQPQEVKAVDVATAIGSSAPQLIGTYGSLALRYRAPSQSNLYAVAMVMGVGHSVAFHIDGAGEDQAQDLGSREGIWWLPNSSASDYLILTNQGQNPLETNLSVSDATGKASTQTITLAPRAMVRYSIRQIVGAASLAGSYGGIKVSAASHAGSLDTLHMLFDPNGGFSAVMKMFDYDPRAQLKERDYAGTGQWTLRAPMLALSNPDPSLAFPVGTLLQPQLFIRNVTSKPVDAALALNWRSDTNTGKASGPALHLSPYETRRVDVAALQDGKTLPQIAQWASVILTTNSLPNEVVAVAASYDQTLKYGAQTPFSDQLAFHWAGSEWQYDPLHDSIITVGNGGTKPTQAAFTILYNQGTQKYELDQTLQPGEQMWMDIGKLIRESIPDKSGKTLPADLTSGSYEIRDLNNHAIGTLFEGKVIYDKTYGHVTYGCGLCCGYKKVQLWLDPLGVDFQGTSDNGVNGLNACGGDWEDTSDAFLGNWSSANTGIATVDYYGTHTGQGVGSTTSSTHGSFTGWRPGTVNCPVQGGSPGGGVNVTPVINSISPAQGLIGNTVSLSISGNGFGSNPSVIAPSTFSTTIQRATNTEIDLTFAISTSSATGSQPIGVTNTQSNLNSNLVSFYVQVPTTLIRDSDYGSGGLGPVNVLTDGSVIDIYGDTIKSSQCGVYENIGYLLVEQHTPPLATPIFGNYDLHEHFSNYSSTVSGQTVPADVDNPIVLAQTILGDTQYYGKTAPSCPGANDNETFDQSLSVIIGTSTYPLTMVNHIQRGFYSGTGNVTVTITTP